MKHGIIIGFTAFLIWGASVNVASAQFGNLGQTPFRPRPTVSPFINMGAGGAGALGYYGLVRPQLDATKTLMSLQNTLNRMNPDGSLQGPLDQADPTKPGATVGLQTGHPVTYFNYSHYYPLTPTGTGTTSVGGLGLGGHGGLNTGFTSGVGTSPIPRTFYSSVFTTGR